MRMADEEEIGQVHTKIVATLGPASTSPDRIDALIRAGVDVFRLNFSHGTHDGHATAFQTIRNCSDSQRRPIAILMDLCGPKIRLGPVSGGQIDCPLDAEFSLVANSTGDNPSELTCTYPDLCAELEPGQTILLADGVVAMKVVDCSNSRVRLRVVLAGQVRSNQGLNLPDSKLALSSITEKDLADLQWLKAHPVEYVGLSFVRSASDIERLRSELVRVQSHALIVAKIEKPQAVQNLDSIVDATDAVMVARGDLGVELDVVRVPGVQKRIIRACHRARVPVITATEMLASMERSSRPTRAEASDVYNSVLDGTDAVMLSGETAIGAYPIEAVRTMSRIVEAAESESRLLNLSHPAMDESDGSVTSAIVEAAAIACDRLQATLLVIETHSGRTAIEASKQRMRTKILALSEEPARVRQLALLWGVTPLQVQDLSDPTSSLREALRWAADRGMVKLRDRIVTLLGTIPGERPYSAMRVQKVTESDLAGPVA
jgi:pyruvate kinase